LWIYVDLFDKPFQPGYFGGTQFWSTPRHVLCLSGSMIGQIQVLRERFQQAGKIWC
jgi:hypothetical protein